MTHSQNRFVNLQTTFKDKVNQKIIFTDKVNLKNTKFLQYYVICENI